MSKVKEFVRVFFSLLAIVLTLAAMFALFGIGQTLIVAGAVFFGCTLVALGVILFIGLITWLVVY